MEDHDVLSQALAVALGNVEIDAAVATELDAFSVLEQVRHMSPSVTLLDLHLGVHGTSHGRITDLVEAGTRVVVLTASEDRDSVAEALRNGAAAFVQKSEPFDRLVAVIRDVAGGTEMPASHRAEMIDELRAHERERHPLLERFRSLSSRETEVLGQLIAGLTPAEIAETQFVALSTVRSQQKSIYRKLGVNTQLAAVALARRAGWAPSS